jgi:uncharacterized membrane protein
MVELAMISWPIRLWQSFSAVGLLAGTLFLAASLTPSMLPRDFITQGALSGFSLAAGYGIGVLGQWLWAYLEIPEPGRKSRHWTKLIALIVFAAIAGVLFVQATNWQNTIRDLMNLERVDDTRSIWLGLITVAIFIVTIGVARLFGLVIGVVSGRLRRFIPRRVAAVLGIAIATVLFGSLIDGVIFRNGMRLADSAFQALDELIEAEIEQPLDPSKTGSGASLLDWDELGRAGREYISTGPDRRDLEAYSGDAAVEPLRVYVGLRSAETVKERARLAVDELKRVGGFSRSVLVVIVPTGTGWVDPAAMNPVEYLHGGDIASVAVQYSYLTSFISIFVEPDYSAEVARALFREVYQHWTSLPKDDRPRLYLHGLSLGSLGSQKSANVFEFLDDPIDGALWSGSPFPSELWRAAVDNRVPGSPAWLPRVGDGSLVRFTTQENALASAGEKWGSMRVVYLQYPSDPIVFFEPTSFYKEPAWMKHPRGPEISPDFRWYPVVTFLQTLFDITRSTSGGMGNGHVYAPEHYIDAWVEVTDVQGWSAEEISGLKDFFRAQR